MLTPERVTELLRDYERLNDIRSRYPTGHLEANQAQLLLLSEKKYADWQRGTLAELELHLLAVELAEEYARNHPESAEQNLPC